MRSLIALGKGPEPAQDVFEGCEELICRMLSVKEKHLLQRRSYSGMYSAVETLMVRVDKLSPTQDSLFTFVEYIYNAVFGNRLSFKRHCS